MLKIIDLDNHDIEHCKKQLKNDDWDQNVLMLYIKDSPGTDKFRAIYERVSIEHPNRHLFALAVFDPTADANWKVVFI